MNLRITFILVMILSACAPSLHPRRSALNDDFQPFYYSYMEPGAGAEQSRTNQQIRFKGTHDSENPNNMFFLIEPSIAFQAAPNKVSIILLAGGLQSVKCTNGGVNEIDCAWRNLLASSTKAQTACESSFTNLGTYSPELFASSMVEQGFNNSMIRISNGSTTQESVFDIPSFYVNGAQRYSHAIIISDLNLFCRANPNGGQAACVGSDGLPASSCYFAATLPEIPPLLESEDSF